MRMIEERLESLFRIQGTSRIFSRSAHATDDPNMYTDLILYYTSLTCELVYYYDSGCGLAVFRLGGGYKFETFN